MGAFTVVPLGTLEKVRVRDAWPDEARNFTPWLATDGLDMLSNEIGVTLRVIRQEHAVGRYSLDILATSGSADIAEDLQQLVVIENQFGSTDHDHLGKLMTYASGVGQENEGAKTVIWIAEDFRDEHRRALEWLNEVTQSGVRFYGVQLELYKIGTSAVAPSLNVLVRPNEVIRARRDISAPQGESERNLFYIEYWTAFKEYCVNNSSLFQLQSARPEYYIYASLGRSNTHLSFRAGKRDRWIGCELYIDDTNPAVTFAALERDRTVIDQAIPGLTWTHKTGSKNASIFLRNETPPEDRSLWATQHAWLLEKGNLLYREFSARVRNLGR